MAKKQTKASKAIKHTDAEVQAHAARKKADNAAAAEKKGATEPTKANVRLADISRAADAAAVADHLGPIGTKYSKIYKGKEYVAERVADCGFTCALANPEVPDAIYESLTSVMRTITGMTNPSFAAAARYLDAISLSQRPRRAHRRGNSQLVRSFASVTTKCADERARIHWTTRRIVVVSINLDIVDITGSATTCEKVKL